MSHKIKSSLYFTSLVLAVVTYYSFENNDAIQNTELVENTIEQVSTVEALH